MAEMVGEQSKPLQASSEGGEGGEVARSCRIWKKAGRPSTRSFRSCVACRATAPRQEMLRFVLGPDQELVFDGLGRLPGRGAHTCALPECVRRAVLRRCFDRSLRSRVSVVRVERTIEQVRGWLFSRFLGLLGLARRSGRIAVGGDEAERALADHGLGLLVIATDLSPRRGHDIEARARAGGVQVASAGSKEALGHAIGRPPTGILGIRRGPQLDHLLLVSEMLLSFVVDPGAVH